MYKAYALWVVHAWLFCASIVSAADGGVVVSIQDSVVSNFEVPGILSCAVLVTNLDSVSHDLVESVVAPNGWQLIGGSPAISIAPFAREIRIVALAAKGQTPPGEYQFTYQIHEANDPTPLSQQSLSVQVKPVIVVELSVSEAPLFVEAGKSYRITFSILHKGNAAAAIGLDVKSSSGFRVALDSNTIVLAPNEIRQLVAEVITPKALSHPVKDRLFIRATAGQDSMSSNFQTYSIVSVVPASARTEAKYRQLPSRFTTRYVGGDGKDGVQFELAGSGPLDDHGHTIDYRIRGPEKFENNVFGLRDEVYLKLRSKEGAIIGGDYSYAVSNLLERGRLGRGVEVDLDHKQIEARAIGFQSRAQIPDYEAYGGYIGFSQGRRFSLRGNTLIKKTTQSDDELFSVSTSFEPASQWIVNLESATGTKKNEYSDQPLAFWSRIDGRVSTTQISLQKHAANREFHGQIQDVDQNLVDLFTALPYGFGWVNAYRDFSENLAKSLFVPTAPREKHFRTGLNFRKSSFANASLDFETHTRVDMLPSPDFDNRVSLLVARVQKAFRMIGLSSTVMRGVRKNYLTSSSSDLENYRLSADAHPIRGQRCEGWWQTGHSSYSIDTRRSNVLGFNAEYATLPRLELNASVQVADRDDNRDFESLQYDVGVQYEPFKKHFVVLKLRKRDFDELQFDHETSYLLSYQLPVGVPIGRKRDRGSLQGRIYDLDNSATGGVPGALLRVGDRTTLSDKNGRFVFHSLTRGVHYLQIENAAFGLDRVPLQRMPIELNISGAQTESVELQIVKTGSISGKVIVYGYANENTERGVLIENFAADSMLQKHRDLQPLRDLADCVVQLNNGEEFITTSTSSDGSFEVTKLRPGKWTLSVLATGLPEFHRSEQETYTIILDPGQAQACELRVVPRTRRLLIAATGSLRFGARAPESSFEERGTQSVLSKPDSVEKSAEATHDIKTYAAVTSGIWYVQTGAYRSQTFAQKKAAELRANGFDAAIVPIESKTGAFYQVRAGGFATPSDASQAALVLAQEFKCDTLVISTQLPATDHISTFARNLAQRMKSSAMGGVISIPANDSGAWYVQLGAYRLQTNVDRLTSLLESAGIRFELVPIATGTGTITQVRVGGFDTILDSKSVSLTLDTLLESRSLVITSSGQ
jgi:cell division septation protein DedD